MPIDTTGDVPPPGETSEYTRNLYYPKGAGWPDDPTIHIRRHRIAFFSAYGVIIDPGSTVPYQQQIREREGVNTYGNLVFTMQKHEMYMSALTLFAKRYAEKKHTFPENEDDRSRDQVYKRFMNDVLAEMKKEWPAEHNWARQVKAFYVKTFDADDVNVSFLMKRKKGGPETDVVIVNSDQVFEILAKKHYHHGMHRGSVEMEERVLQKLYQGIPQDVVTKFRTFWR